MAICVCLCVWASDVGIPHSDACFFGLRNGQAYPPTSAPPSVFFGVLVCRRAQWRRVLGHDNTTVGVASAIQ